jgi:hypothetical protein
MLSSNQFCKKSAVKSGILISSLTQIPFSEVNQCGYKDGTFPITGTPHFIDSRGNVPKPLVSSIQIETNDSFERAFFQKENIIKSIDHISDDDIVYYGDLDEIWKPQEIDDKVYKLHQLNYSYYLNNRSSEEWIGTLAGKFKNIKALIQ